MKTINTLLILCTLFLSIQNGYTKNKTIERMRCEYLDSPIGIDVLKPRFTWNIESTKTFYQKSYRVRVATSPELLVADKADIWNSEVIDSDRSLAIYDGKDLNSFSKYYWDVVVYDNNKNRILSEISIFETAIMNPSDWKAKWISDNFDKEFRKSPMLRKKFIVDKEIKSARVYVSGVGYYELYLNGDKVGDHLLDPGYTHFDKRVLYCTYDITSMLRNGDNAIGALLGNGWLNIQSLAVWRFETAQWRMRPRLMCQLQIEYSNGDKDVICSDESWKTNTGAHLFNNLYSGNHYDARLEKSGWKNHNYDDNRWDIATVVDPPASKVVAQAMPPIRVTEEIKPISFKKIGENRYIYDIGKNITGVCRLRIKGEAGTSVTLEHGELIHPNGELNSANIDVYFQRQNNDAAHHKDPNEIFQSDTYYLKGGSDYEEFTPLFTYHGFQYVKVESDKPIEISKESLTALFIHTDVEEVGSFSCSNNDINKFIDATRMSYLGNLHSIPTDCPQREKNGWTADACIALDMALSYYDGITVYEKWFDDIADNQKKEGNISGIVPSAGWGYDKWIGPVWDAAMFIMPDKIYSYYGDSRAIEEIYPTCKRYLEYLKGEETDGILTYGLGDWVFYKTKTDSHYTSTLFYWLDNVLMAKFAKIVGDDPTPYSDKANKLLNIIQEKWFDKNNALYANGTQAGQAVALALGIVPKEYEDEVAKRLVEMIRSNKHNLDFGLLGSKFVPAMLTKFGYTEDAYKMITNPNEPSWISWIQKGYTTLPETWILNKDYKDASFNHIFLGDASAWMIQTIAGINYDEQNPGYKHIIIHPHFIKDLNWAKGSYNSVMGEISSNWERKNGNINLTVKIPSNTTATLHLEKPIKLNSGTHNFTVNDL